MKRSPYKPRKPCRPVSQPSRLSQTRWPNPGEELAQRRVDVLSPGLVDTPANDWMETEARRGMLQGMAARLPVQRIGMPEEIAVAVLFLMHKSYVTGAVLDVDRRARLG